MLRVQRRLFLEISLRERGLKQEGLLVETRKGILGLVEGFNEIFLLSYIQEVSLCREHSGLVLLPATLLPEQIPGTTLPLLEPGTEG